MGQSSTTLHEERTALSERTVDIHRALVSIQEELEAVDWYRQRAEGASDPELRELLLHNMREEIEHASMLLEWVRRRDPDFQKQFSTYLFTSAPLMDVEEAAEAEEATEALAEDSAGPEGKEPPDRPRVTIGHMKGD